MKKMPVEIREVFEALEQEVVWLHLKWQYYRQLFGSSEERIELLNSFAPLFFKVCQDVLLDDVILSISRLSDPMKTGDRGSKKESLSLLRLVNMVEPNEYPDLRPILQKLWGKVDNLCQPFRSHRHQRIAHNNWETIRSTSELLPGISRQSIEDALESIQRLMSAINEYFDDSVQSFVIMNPAAIDGEVLINHLEILHEYYSTNDLER
ncbi:MAG: hypothetical protein R2932_33695 [Caldilineaceae bacterium]